MKKDPAKLPRNQATSKDKRAGHSVDFREWKEAEKSECISIGAERRLCRLKCMRLTVMPNVEVRGKQRWLCVDKHSGMTRRCLSSRPLS